MNDGRALTKEQLLEIHRNVFNGLYNDWELLKVFETIEVQRRVLLELFQLFHKESPLRLVYVADPIRSSSLAYLKELVSMEDER